MEIVHNNGEYPRPLSAREREWIEWILPEDRPAYASYRTMLKAMMVIGQGRRGPGEIILGAPEDKPDFSEPLTPVAAYGAIETDIGTISVTLREPIHEQLSVEMVCQTVEDIPHRFRELRRWSYSGWQPGNTCPQCLRPVREISLQILSPTMSHAFLALCPTDKRVWVHDRTGGLNHLIPVTNYYNELMLHKNIRDPGIALDASNLFRDLSRYSDGELAYAFMAYNRLKTKIQAPAGVEVPRDDSPGIRGAVRKLFRLKS